MKLLPINFHSLKVQLGVECPPFEYRMKRLKTNLKQLTEYKFNGEKIYTVVVE